MISIITITYNRKNLLKIAIDSVLAQSFADFEYIIIDDGSTDGTEEMVADYKDGRIKYFYENHIAQLTKIRNIGIKKAAGEIIAFLDSDDYWHPNYLEKINKIYATQNVVSTICNAFVFTETEKKTFFNIARLPNLLKGNILEHKLLKHYPLIYPSCFSVLKNLNLDFNEALKAGDNDFFLRALALGDTFIIIGEMVYIRKHDSNMSSLQTYDSSFIQAYNEEFVTLDYLKENKIIGELIYRKTYSIFLNKQANNFLVINKKSAAWLGYLRAFLKYPMHLKFLAKLFLVNRYW